MIIRWSEAMKKHTSLIALVFFLSLTAWGPLSAQTYQLKLEVVFNDGVNIDVKASIKGSSTFGLFTSTLLFSDSTNPIGGLSSPTIYATYNFSGGNYNNISLNQPSAYKVALNIVLNGNPSTTVNTTWTDIATVRFTITNTSATANFNWYMNSGWTAVYKDNYPNNPIEVFADTVVNSTGNLLPVELVSFTGRIVDQSVRLHWTTSTEINSSRFDVERSSNGTDFRVIGSVAGQGTSNTPNDYTYMDNDLGSFYAYWYRLNMIDRDGTHSYSGMVRISAAALAKMPQLYATYPNPIHPQATVHFMLPVEQAVTIVIFDINGNEALRLFDNQVLASGYYVRVLDASQLPSGKYFLRMTAGAFERSENLVIEK
jgi:hypothetical protein